MIARYTNPEMGRIWSDQRKYETWLQVELAAVDAMARAGIVPQDAARDLRARASFDIARIEEIEQVTQHDVIAFTTAVAERVGPSARWLHFGLTSSDVIDTAQALQMRERADRARQLADGDDLARPLDARHVARQLRVPQRQLQAERHRLGVHAVRAADHRRAAMLLRARPHRLHQAVQVLQDQIARLAHLQRLRGVDDVRRRHAEVQPAGRRAHVLGHGGGKGDHVVLRDALDLFDARHGEGALVPDVACGLGRGDAGVGHRLDGCDFDLQPRFVLALVAPDATHVRMGVAPNHVSRDATVLAESPVR